MECVLIFTTQFQGSNEELTSKSKRSDASLIHLLFNENSGDSFEDIKKFQEKYVSVFKLATLQLYSCR